jgi:serine/threonine protein kinase
MNFGQYELRELIAVGGMAEVYKGRVVGAEGFEKYVAIKRILPDLAADERFVKMLLTEARIHSALSHRNIVQIHDLGISEGGEYFIVLEYIEGYDLRIITEQLAAEKEIVPEALSLYIAAEVAEGLHFAHEMRGPDGQPLGLVHRDVTPSNVLISFAGEVKLSDFGLAKRRHDHSVVGSLKGNLAYMSPEQAKQAPLDRRTDIFSLGALLYELLTGRRLREITDELAGWSQVASGVVPSARRFRPDLPPAIERLLDVALAPDPANRFPDAAAFGAAIRDALTKLSVPVGASDLAALLGVVTPPRRSRSIMMEPSKVIRLGSEAQALHEAIAAPITPAPVVSPGMTPASPRATDQASVRFRDPAATPQVDVNPPSESRDPMATPPPAAPLPPPRARGLTPAASAAREAARARVATPARTDGGPGVRPASGAPSPSRTPPSPAGGLRSGGERTPPAPAGQPRGPLYRTPSYGVERPAAAEPSKARQTGPQPLPASARKTGPQPLQPNARKTGPQPLPPNARKTGPQRLPPSARQTGPQPLPSNARQTGPQPLPSGRRQTGPHGSPPPSFVMPREARETARVQLRSSGSWLKRLLAVLVLVAGAAAAVHFYLVPLEVLVVWRQPARVSLTTDPSGASLRLDGALVDTSPTSVSVTRDRLDHTVEATKPGYRPARATVRFDRSVGITVRVHLEPEPSVAPPPGAGASSRGGASSSRTRTAP